MEYIESIWDYRRDRHAAQLPGTMQMPKTMDAAQSDPVYTRGNSLA